MPIHIDVLGRLHVLLGGFAALAGVSLLVLAVGTAAALGALPDVGAIGDAGAWILGWCGLAGLGGGVALGLTGRALTRRRPWARTGALVLAVPHLLVVPFGTALGIYAFWVLLNDEARRQFGRRVRGVTPGHGGVP